MRIVVLDRDKCKPKKCSKECRTSCPVVRSGTELFEFKTPTSKPVIYEQFCTGCGICTSPPRGCRFRALSIINTPEQLDTDVTHRFGRNEFTLFRLPIVKPQSVTGLVGQNGIGKSTALTILSGELIPNLGDFETQPDWNKVLDYYKGTELQNYFEKMITKKIKCIRKPQYIDKIPKVVSGTVSDIISRMDERNIAEVVITELSLDKLLDREIKQLSGGELQKFAIAIALVRNGDIYLFDEPSSFLDIYERLRVGKAIRKLAEVDKKTVVVIEHDLAVLDYLSDYITVFYGDIGKYGIVSYPYSNKEGINVFLDGYIPSENMRFREYSITIDKSSFREQRLSTEILLEYSQLKKVYKDSNFKLEVNSGKIHSQEVIGILGPNGIGKTTFIKILAGLEEVDSGSIKHSIRNKDNNESTEDVEEKLTIAYKPQYLTFGEGEITVQQYLLKVGKSVVATSRFKSEILRPFKIERLLSQQLSSLSGGELQKVAIASVLAQDADLYLFDEPSAYLSIEDRLTVAKIIRRNIQNNNKAAFIVEHDIVFQDYVSDRIMVFLGEPGVSGRAYSPMGIRNGMNKFLANLQITFRRDTRTGRPRVNKLNSKLDKLQKQQGEYYYEK